MNVQIPEAWQSFVRHQVETGRYASEEAVLEEALRLLRQRDSDSVTTGQNEAQPSQPESAWQRVLEDFAALPDEVFDRIPADSAEQLDHYLYGARKRPTA